MIKCKKGYTCVDISLCNERQSCCRHVADEKLAVEAQTLYAFAPVPHPDYRNATSDEIAASWRDEQSNRHSKQMLVPVEYRIEMLETEVKQCQQKVKELEARSQQLLTQLAKALNKLQKA